MYKFAIPYNNSTVDKFIRKVIEPVRESVDEVYFSLPPFYGGNARGVIAKQKTLDELAGFIKSCGVPCNLVINSGFNPVSSYMPSELTRTTNAIEVLVKAGLQRITLNNPFMVRTRIWRMQFPSLRFIASVNMVADTLHKLDDLTTLFQFEEIVLDRAFNRDMLALHKASAMLKKKGILRKILVNEGCLLGCPFKNFHDQLVGQASYFDSVGYQDYTLGLTNKYEQVQTLIPGLCDTYACGEIYQSEPWRFLSSPVIRPEDLHVYAPYGDSFKIAGRACSTDEIVERVQAYVNQSYDGALQDIVEASRFEPPIPNKGLDVMFTLSCNKVCSECGKCKEYYEKHIAPKQPAPPQEESLNEY
jgi:collagenase-like PrtC family protease